MTSQEQAFVIAVTVHRVLARHRPYETCDECPQLRKRADRIGGAT